MMAHTSQHEDELVRKAQRGDDVAFDRLVEVLAPRVYGLAYRLVGNADDAQDMAQESFLRIYRALPTFKGNAAFSTWMYRIVANCCYDELSKRKQRPATATDITAGDDGHDWQDRTADATSAVEDVWERRERQQAVQTAIRALPEHARMVVVLYDLQGLSYQEIAVALKTNVGTVKSRLNRARLQLRELLSEHRELFGAYARHTIGTDTDETPSCARDTSTSG
jgi:RNA polymerase sigma-70 factor (ECF subfamily)